MLLPVAVNTFALLLIAAGVNTLTGRPYPHRPPPPAPTGRATELGVQPADVAVAMTRSAQRLDVLPADVVALVREAETYALNRRLAALPVGRIMNRDVATARAFESIYQTRLVIAQQNVKSLPVIDDDRRLLGIVSIGDLFNREIVERQPVESIMTTRVSTVRESTHVSELVPLMTDRELPAPARGRRLRSPGRHGHPRGAHRGP